MNHLATVCGTIGAIYARPLQRNLEGYNAIFRKPWMRLPLQGAAFGCAFYGGLQLPARLFPKLTYSKFEGVNNSYYTSSQDMVGKFRLFETFDQFDSHEDIATYLSVYSTQPLTKNEMMDNLALHALKEFDLGKLFRIKRGGKDRDPVFWSFGKVHGLENLAFADEEEVKATNGNPVSLQMIADKAEGNPLQIHSYEHLVQEIQGALRDYKEKVESLNMNPSDTKKILSLPFYLSKRQQLPEPRQGQSEFELFQKLTGQNWYADARTIVDEEHKITEFDYENYIDKDLLPRQANPEFKRLIRVLNLFTHTQHEQLLENKEHFKEFMPILRNLSADEQETLIHKIRNSGRHYGNTDNILDEMTQQTIEKKLAAISEEENYNSKNRYRLSRTKLDYADKKRMPIDESKLKDVLKNQPTFKAAISQ